MSSYSVLIIEDEPVERRFLVDIIKKNYPVIGEILSSGNGWEALHIAEERKPDIILADISIPGISGLELIEKLRESGSNAKVLMTTAYDLFDYAKRAISSGATGYILKPIDIAELHEGLEKCFSLIEKERKLESGERGIAAMHGWAGQHIVHDSVSGVFHPSEMAGAYGFP